MDTAHYTESTTSKLLTTLEQLLAIQVTGQKPALDASATLIAEAIGADKSDTFLHEPNTQTLVAIGTSTTAMGQHQKALGLDRLPIANGGRAVQVFQNGVTHHDGHVDADTQEVRGIREALGVKSSIIVPLDVGGKRRGAVLVSSARPIAFSAQDRVFIEVVARWVALVIQRAEFVEQLTREATDQARRLVAEEIITILAHDLGNYLTPLVSRLYVLRTRAERDGRTHDVTEADAFGHSLHNLRRFVDGLLDVARIEQGVFALVCRPTNISELARDVAGGARTATTSLVVQAPTDVIAPADPARLRQALENLLANARQHAPGSAVTVGAHHESRTDGEYAVLSVRDNGPGIPAEAVPRLLERFVRGTRAQGLGIGLYLVRSIAEAHGGKLEVESAIGQGTVFRIVLPMEPASRHQL